ncbi:hypothetical protein LguiA_005638 [Lonicera macranthoides]
MSLLKCKNSYLDSSISPQRLLQVPLPTIPRVIRILTFLILTFLLLTLFLFFINV